MLKSYFYPPLMAIALLVFSGCSQKQSDNGLKISENGYFEMPGLNVLVFNNSYSEGHQGGVEIIQHGNRVATGGNLRLSPAPGQWQPVPKLGEGFEKVGCSPQQIGLMMRKVDRENNTISLNCSYPDEGRQEKGFNPIIYPDLEIAYNVSVTAKGKSFTITLDLEEPLPEEWVGQVGYNLEFFPGDLYGKTYIMDDQSGIFPRQANGPVYLNHKSEAEAVPLAVGRELTIAPESDLQRIRITNNDGNLMLLDGSLKHNNGWFVVRSLIPPNTTSGAIQWTIEPHVIDGWIADPVIHHSQVGYHPKMEKTAFIELDRNATEVSKVTLRRIKADGTSTVVKSGVPKSWGSYLRYEYYTFDFSDVHEKGNYYLEYGNGLTTNPFPIAGDVYQRHVWEPTLEYFLPVQMCHMRVNQKYRVWHGACHLDDALMAPLNIAHFDGYNNMNETSTLTAYKPLENVPGLNVGGWHDAGDYDIRVESQSSTVIALSLAYEEFGIDYDVTMVDAENRHVELHRPDGKADLLQQVEHGVISILSGYRQFGMLYRGIIVPTLRQYVHLGDAATQTNNIVFEDALLKSRAAAIDSLWYKEVANRYSAIFDPELFLERIQVVAPDLDDRLVFMETNPARQLYGAAALAAASRVLSEFNPDLAAECILVAEDLYADNKNSTEARAQHQKIHTLSELILCTGKDEYKRDLAELSDFLEPGFRRYGWSVGRVLPLIEDTLFTGAANRAARKHKVYLDSVYSETPFGVPLEGAPYLGFGQYYLNKSWPELFGFQPVFDAINYIFGTRPGRTTNSLISGVGGESPVVAYGTNRADWSYIPGGTFWNAVNLVSPDYAEDKVWPFLWQEREYIITTPCYHMFAVLAAKDYLENRTEGK